MKRSEFKKALKPLIKECIKEVIFEEGVLSNIISEVVAGTSVLKENVPTVKTKKKQPISSPRANTRQTELRKNSLQKTQKNLLEAIGKSSQVDIGDINIFEGTKPLSEGGVPGKSAISGPMSNYASDDPGVDISGLFNQNWKNLV